MILSPLLPINRTTVGLYRLEAVLKSSSRYVFHLPPEANYFPLTVALDPIRLHSHPVGGRTYWHCVAGASDPKFTRSDRGVKHDVLLNGIGVQLTFEVIAAASHIPSPRVRVVDVIDLMIPGLVCTLPPSITKEGLSLFTVDQPSLVSEWAM